MGEIGSVKKVDKFLAQICMPFDNVEVDEIT
jgi:hypothetical protein